MDKRKWELGHLIERLDSEDIQIVIWTVNYMIRLYPTQSTSYLIRLLEKHFENDRIFYRIIHYLSDHIDPSISKDLEAIYHTTEGLKKLYIGDLLAAFYPEKVYNDFKNTLSSDSIDDEVFGLCLNSITKIDKDNSQSLVVNLFMKLRPTKANSLKLYRLAQVMLSYEDSELMNIILEKHISYNERYHSLLLDAIADYSGLSKLFHIDNISSISKGISSKLDFISKHYLLDCSSYEQQDILKKVGMLFTNNQNEELSNILILESRKLLKRMFNLSSDEKTSDDEPLTGSTNLLKNEYIALIYLSEHIKSKSDYRKELWLMIIIYLKIVRLSISLSDKDKIETMRLLILCKYDIPDTIINNISSDFVFYKNEIIQLLYDTDNSLIIKELLELFKNREDIELASFTLNYIDKIGESCLTMAKEIILSNIENIVNFLEDNVDVFSELQVRLFLLIAEDIDDYTTLNIISEKLDTFLRLAKPYVINYIVSTGLVHSFSIIEPYILKGDRQIDNTFLFLCKLHSINNRFTEELKTFIYDEDWQELESLVEDFSKKPLILDFHCSVCQKHFKQDAGMIFLPVEMNSTSSGLDIDNALFRNDIICPYCEAENNYSVSEESSLNIMFHMLKLQNKLQQKNNITFEADSKVVFLNCKLPDGKYTNPKGLYEYYKDIAMSDKGNIINMIRYGNVLRNLRKYNRALDVYDNVLNIDEKNIEARYNKALTLEDMCQIENASIEFEKTLSYLNKISTPTQLQIHIKKAILSRKNEYNINTNF